MAGASCRDHSWAPVKWVPWGLGLVHGRVCCGHCCYCCPSPIGLVIPVIVVLVQRAWWPARKSDSSIRLCPQGSSVFLQAELRSCDRWSHSGRQDLSTREQEAWSTPEYHGASQGTMGQYGAPRGTMGHYGALWGTMGHHRYYGAPQGTTEHHGVPWDMVEYHRTLRDSVGHYRTPWGIIGHYGVLRDTTGHHGAVVQAPLLFHNIERGVR